MLCAVAVLEARFVSISDRSPVDLSGIPLQRFKLVSSVEGLKSNMSEFCSQAAAAVKRPPSFPLEPVFCRRTEGSAHGSGTEFLSLKVTK